MYSHFSKRTLAFVSLGLMTLAACSGSGSGPVAPVIATPTATAAATATPTPIAATPTPTPVAATPSPTAVAVTPTPTPAPTAQPQIVHVGFNHAATTDATYGMVADYSPTSGAAAVVSVVHGSQIVFTNDGSGAPHTASGLGTSGFPASFDNASGSAAAGSTADGSLTWSTGTLDPGASSAAFTVGPAGTYYFGCAFHYNSSGMRDVLVSM